MRCRYCNKDFEKTVSTKLYCNDKCRQKYNSRLPRVCEYNKKYFQTQKGKEGVKKYHTSKKGRLKHYECNNRYRKTFLGRLAAARNMVQYKTGGARENFSAERWFFKLYKTQGFCPQCDKWYGIDKLHKDHTPALSKVSSDFIYTIDNVQPLCIVCNSSKGNR